MEANAHAYCVDDGPLEPVAMVPHSCTGVASTVSTLSNSISSWRRPTLTNEKVDGSAKAAHARLEVLSTSADRSESRFPLLAA
jgi:hypothetical protein